MSNSAAANIKYFLPSFLRQFILRLEASPLGYRLARGAFWSVFGAVIARGLGLVSSILVARMLGKSIYGEFGIIQSTVGMLGTFGGFALGMTATKFIAEYRTTDPEKAGRIRALSSAFAWISSAIASIVLFVFAPLLAVHVLAAPHLATVLRMCSLYLFFSAVNQAQTGALSGFEAFKTIAKINICSGFVSFPLMIIGVYYGGLIGAVWGMTITTGFNWIINNLALRKVSVSSGVPYNSSDCLKEISVLWRFSLPAVASGLFFAPTEWALNALLVKQPGGYGQMGLFNAAKQWHALILYVPFLLSNLTLPILSNLLGEGNKQQYNKMILINSLMISGIALALALPVALLAGPIMAVYGNGFIDGKNVLVLVAVYSFFWAANIVIGQVLWSTGSSGLAFVLAASRAIIILVTFALFTPKTALGLALAYTITYVLQTIYQGGLTIWSLKKTFSANPVTAEAQTIS